MSENYNEFEQNNTYTNTEVVSEPYRYRYENGEKAEDTRYNHYYYGNTQNTYRSETVYGAPDNATKGGEKSHSSIHR